jgi:hypothetical protein
MPEYGYTERTDLVTRLLLRLLPGSETCRFTEPSKNHLAGWFFRLQSKRLRLIAKDLKKILYGLLSDPRSSAMPVTVDDGETAPPPVSRTLFTWHAANTIEATITLEKSSFFISNPFIFILFRLFLNA